MRFVLLALVFAAAPVAAQIYKWVDEKGKVHYGEKPPAGAKSAPLRGEALPQSGAPRAPEDLGRQEEAFRERQARQRLQEERDASMAADNKLRCENSRGQLENAERFRLYRRVNGEKVYYSDEEKNAELTRLRGAVSRYCR